VNRQLRPNNSGYFISDRIHIFRKTLEIAIKPPRGWRLRA